jgi:hypothetical protein
MVTHPLIELVGTLSESLDIPIKMGKEEILRGNAPSVNVEVRVGTSYTIGVASHIG